MGQFNTVFKNKGDLAKSLGVRRNELSLFLSTAGYQSDDAAPSLECRSSGWTAYVRLNIGKDFWLWNEAKVTAAYNRRPAAEQEHFAVYPFFPLPEFPNIVSYRHLADVLMAKCLQQHGLGMVMDHFIDELLLHVKVSEIQPGWLEESEDRLAIELDSLRVQAKPRRSGNRQLSTVR